MENDEIVPLLREIRDLQKLHVEDYKDALRNQQAAIELQSKAGRFQKRSLLVLLVAVLLGVAALIMPIFTTH